MSKKKRKNSNYKINTSVKSKNANEKLNIKPLPTIIVSLISLVLIAVIVLVSFISCYGGSCHYAENRDIEGRDIVYAEMSVKGYGKVTLLLDRTTAPITVDNFVSLVNDKFYDGLTFHRIVDNFMIQGGDPKANGTGNSENEIYGEFSSNGHINDIQHIDGVISMARGEDPNSASCQFFICNADSPHLNGNYAAFGYVIDGLNVIHRITRDCVKKTTGGVIKDKNQQPVIEYIRIIEAE